MSIALHPRLPLTDIPDPLSLQYPFDMHQLVVKVMSQTKCGKRDPTANVFPRTCLLWRDIDRSDQLQEYAEPPIVIPFKKDVHLHEWSNALGLLKAGTKVHQERLPRWYAAWPWRDMLDDPDLLDDYSSGSGGYYSEAHVVITLQRNAGAYMQGQPSEARVCAFECLSV
jgi:hypothetical protein